MKNEKQPLQHNQRQLLGLLGVGYENIKETKYLTMMMQVDSRMLRRIIKTLVESHGVPIIGIRTGEKTGYYIASNTTELLEGARTYYSQIREEQKRFDALMKTDLRSWKELLKEEVA